MAHPSPTTSLQWQCMQGLLLLLCVTCEREMELAQKHHALEYMGQHASSHQGIGPAQAHPVLA